MDYGKIITRAWEIIWQHKILWVFGILSGFIGSASSFSTYFRRDFGAIDLSEWPSSYSPYSEDVINFLRWGSENIYLFVVGAILIVLFFIVLTNAFYAFGISGTIQGNLLVAEGSEHLSFGMVAKEIRPYFWRVFGLYLLLGVGGFGVVIGLFGILTIIGILTIGIGFLCILPLICLLVPLSWFLMIVVNIALIAIIAEDLDIKDGLLRGWRMVTGNIGPFLLVWLIIVVISFVFNILISLPQTIAIAPVYGVLFSAEYLHDPSIFIQTFNKALPVMLIWIPFLVVLRGILTAYTQSAWVQTYLEVRDDGTLEELDEPDEVNPEPENLEQTT